MEGYSGIKDETRDFIENLMGRSRSRKLWRHQEEAVLRAIYCREVLGKKNILENIVTGGGKTLIIACIVAWLRLAFDLRKFLLLTPNLIVKDRLEIDFEGGKIFKEWQLF